MASITTSSNGTRRILFVDAHGDRKTLYLGTMPKRLAEEIRLKVEALAAAQRSGLPMDAETASWLGRIGDDLADKLARVGLIPRRQAAPKQLLGNYVDSYLAKRNDLKPASRIVIGQVIVNLKDYFGTDRPLDSINAGDVDDFKRWLGTQARKRGGQQGEEAGLSPATVGKRLKNCGTIFRDAMKRKLIAENPFAGIKHHKASNAERQAYVPAATIAKLIEQAPDAEWKLLLAMARFLGVRVPSEPFSMTWDCVDWQGGKLRVPSPKTTGHGKSFRVVPILPQVLPHLERCFEEAPEGSKYVFERLRQRESAQQAKDGFWKNLNLRQSLLRMLTRAGIPPWPRLFHNLRASAQTDLANQFPIHVVCSWLGNTRAIANEHYLQVTEEHFQQAISATRNPTQYSAVLNGNALNETSPQNEKTPEFPGGTAGYDVVQSCSVGTQGLEP